MMTVSRKLNILLVLLLGLLLASSLFQLISYYSVSRDARLINELGIIRGGLQRYAKRILHGLPATTTDKEINRLIDHLGNVIEYPQLKKSLAVLDKKWQIFKKRYEQGTAPGTAFLDSSEELWELSVKMVLLAQQDAESKITAFRLVAFVLLGSALIALTLLVFVKRSVRGTLEIRATYDALTGALGRASFEERFEEEFLFAQRREAPLSILYLDLDNFKEINDEFDHATGDQVLKSTSQIMRESIRKGDIMGRLGGEEFVIVLKGAGLRPALRIAEKILTTMRETTFPHGKPVTISIGVSSNTVAETSAQLLRSADHAMYEAKRNGRDRVVSAVDHP